MYITYQNIYFMLWIVNMSYHFHKRVSLRKTYKYLDKSLLNIQKLTSFLKTIYFFFFLEKLRIQQKGSSFSYSDLFWDKECHKVIEKKKIIHKAWEIIINCPQKIPISFPYFSFESILWYDDSFFGPFF